MGTLPESQYWLLAATQQHRHNQLQTQVLCPRGRVGISFLLASLNNLNIFACGIGNAYLNAKYIEKLSTESVIYFGTEKGMVLIIPRALYGIKISGVVWRAKLAETVMLLG